MEALRILHVTPYYAGAWAYGGIPRAVAALVKAQRVRGHAITVATSDAGAADRRSQRRGADGPGPDVRVFPNLSNDLAFRLQLFLPLGLGRFLRERARDFDVAHLHALHNVPTAVAARVLRGAGVPYVLQPHGTAPLIERRRLAKWIFDHTLGRGVVEGAECLVALSEAERADLGRLGVADERICVVPPAIDLAEFDGLPRGSFRRRHGLGAGPLVVYLGKLTPRKQVDKLVEAVALLPSAVRLVVAGPDMGSGGAVRAMVRGRGLA